MAFKFEELKVWNKALNLSFDIHQLTRAFPKEELYVLTSQIKRAVDSAKLAFGDKYRIIPDKRLRECDYGAFTRKPAKKFKDDRDKYVDTPFPNGESYRDVEKRIVDFLDFLKKNYDDKHVAIVAHQAPQLALEVLLKGKTWKQAIDEDWRKKKAWRPGWEYVLE